MIDRFKITEIDQDWGTVTVENENGETYIFRREAFSCRMWDRLGIGSIFAERITFIDTADGARLEVSEKFED